MPSPLDASRRGRYSARMAGGRRSAYLSAGGCAALKPPRWVWNGTAFSFSENGGCCEDLRYACARCQAHLPTLASGTRRRTKGGVGRTQRVSPPQTARRRHGRAYFGDSLAFQSRSAPMQRLVLRHLAWRKHLLGVAGRYAAPFGWLDARRHIMALRKTQYNHNI